MSKLSEVEPGATMPAAMACCSAAAPSGLRNQPSATSTMAITPTSATTEPIRM